MQEEFLQILRTLKQNVYIMTSGVEGDRCAVTVSSVTSLSLEPPLIIVCINKNASMHENLEINKKFCLNLLKSSQIDLANLCSGEDSAIKQKVMSIPTLILFKDGNPIDQRIGALTKNQLLEFLNQHI